MIRAGEVSLSAPMGLCEQELHRWLAQKRDWVQAKLQQQQLHADEVPVRSYSSGDTVIYLGREYPLQVCSAGRSSVSFSDEAGFVVYLSASRGQSSEPERVQAQLHKWFKARARELLLDKTAYICDQLQLTFTDMQLRRTKSKWGHCTSKGVIQYNWLILAAPEAVIDYLVAHEVCHLRHLNHSRSFWNLVAKACPDFKEHKSWLHRYGHTLVV